MPSALLNVPHYKQEFHYSCVAACARMVLAHHGVQQTEEQVRITLGTKPSGTVLRHVGRLRALDFEVSLQESNFFQVGDAIAASVPVVIFLETGPLEHWSIDIAHAVVLIGIDSAAAYVNDPFLDNAPLPIPIAQFELAWARTGRFAAFIRPQPSLPKP